MNLLGFPQRSSRSSELTPQAIELLAHASERTLVVGSDYAAVITTQGIVVNCGWDTQVMIGPMGFTRYNLRRYAAIEHALYLSDAQGIGSRVTITTNPPPNKVREFLPKRVI